MKKKWLDVPALSQGNSSNFASNDWCGRTSASMVYNYYMRLAGHEDQFVVNSPEQNNLIYPDGALAAMSGGKYSTLEALSRTMQGWNRVALFPNSGRNLPLSKEQIATIVEPILGMLNRNNPVVTYTGISTNQAVPKHIIVISGYRIEDNGDIWFLIDDPATMKDTSAGQEKSDYLGMENLQILEPGSWGYTAAKYWLKASKLFDKNQLSSINNDLWCDHKKFPGFTVWLNNNTTADSEYSHYEEGAGIHLPLLIEKVDSLVPSLANLSNYYSHSETDFVGGCFPIGSNTTWHGGLHVMGKDGDTVHAMADGTVVCCRMPEKDTKEEDLNYGSRNFVLIRHVNKNQVWYSLYYHLKSVKEGSEEARKIVWLTQDKYKFTKTKNLRKVASEEGNNPIHTFQPNDTAYILHKKEDPWMYVQRDDVNSAENRGYVLFNSDRMEEVSGNEKFVDKDDVFAPNYAVKAGDVIGYLGNGITSENDKIVKKPILHWSVLSPGLMNKFTHWTEDAGEDFLSDSKKIVKLIEKAIDEYESIFTSDGSLTQTQISELYKDEMRAKKLRMLACRFRSEWSIEWDGKVQKSAFRKIGRTADVEGLKLYNFWGMAKQLDNSLPDDGIVWHYNPVSFIHRMTFSSGRANFTSNMFEPDKTFLLPDRAIKLLAGIGKFHRFHKIMSIVLLGHKGVKGDTLDVNDLTLKRAETLKAILTLDKSKFKQILHDNEWGDRERRIMLSWFTDAQGKPFYKGGVDEDDPVALKTAVEDFQVANKMYKDGDAGEGTFTKMYELMLGMAHIDKFDNVEVRGAGEEHASSKYLPSNCVVDAYFWTSEMPVTLDEYDKEKGEAYKEWSACVHYEIQPEDPFAPRIVPQTGVDEYISLVQRVEGRYPDWSADRVLIALRNISRTNDIKFQILLGTPEGDDISEVPTYILSRRVIKRIIDLSRHTNHVPEVGIADDSFGKFVAMSHVLTGISAGLRRKKDFDYFSQVAGDNLGSKIGSEFIGDAIAKKLSDYGLGENIDNLYAATIAGDLGQSAVLRSEDDGGAYIGTVKSDATYAELIGDIDGFLLGEYLSSDESLRNSLISGDKKLSVLLSDYYSDSRDELDLKINHRQRFQLFEKYVEDEKLLDETQSFATNYAYRNGGVGGAFDGVSNWGGEGQGSKNVIEIFKIWFYYELSHEKSRELAYELCRVK